MLKLSALLYLRNSHLKRGERGFVVATYLQMALWLKLLEMYILSTPIVSCRSVRFDLCLERVHPLLCICLLT